MSLAWLWGVMIAMGAVTYLLRASFLLAGDRLRLPPLLGRALRFVPPAVLSAILAPALLRGDEGAPPAETLVRVLAGAAAGFVAWRRWGMGIALIVGMIALHAGLALARAGGYLPGA